MADRLHDWLRENHTDRTATAFGSCGFCCLPDEAHFSDCPACIIATREWVVRWQAEDIARMRIKRLPHGFKHWPVKDTPDAG